MVEQFSFFLLLLYIYCFAVVKYYKGRSLRNNVRFNLKNQIRFGIITCVTNVFLAVVKYLTVDLCEIRSFLP